MTALEHGEIPPTLGFKTPNPRIDFDKAKARVTTDVEPWPKDRLKRASVTSAGFGGTNGHCVIDHVHNVLPNYVKPGIFSKAANGINGHATNGANGHATNGSNGHASARENAQDTKAHLQHNPLAIVLELTRKADAATHRYVVLPFSAHNQASLKANMNALSEVLDRHSLADVAYTLAVKRSRYIHRGFSIVDKDHVSQLALGQEAKVFSSPQPTRIGFVFTGQGAQWHKMGSGLLEYAVFRKTIDYLDHILEMFPESVPWKIIDVLSGRCNQDLIQTPTVSQTVCTALQIGLVDLLASWSVRPSGVVGHSSGEMAAAYAAGFGT